LTYQLAESEEAKGGEGLGTDILQGSAGKEEWTCGRCKGAARGR